MTGRTRAKMVTLHRRAEALMMLREAAVLAWAILRGRQQPKRWYAIYPHDPIKPFGYGGPA